ncbi:hypothetical protein [Acetobacter conturbans]|uniref:hypothetical protein n=1 Tax=Acetobacter conturbans TaxID=1737472 RepID=UPI0015683C8E|nr:hypothetical protein [Acetobacter conturbans]
MRDLRTGFFPLMFTEREWEPEIVPRGCLFTRRNATPERSVEQGQAGWSAPDMGGWKPVWVFIFQGQVDDAPDQGRMENKE